ncbi:MAG: aspartate kinase [Thermoplasmata archaeon]
MTVVGPPIVIKFGGSSIDDPSRVIGRVAELRARRTAVILVVSARGGVTDRLRAILRRPTDRRGHRTALRAIARRHVGISNLGTLHLRRLARLVTSLEEIGIAEETLSDRILSHGERLAAVWLTDRLCAAGIRATAVEADHLGLVTDNGYGRATILLERSRASVARGLSSILRRGGVPVVTGYFGRSLEGRVATLGRGGSDYSATAIAALVGARRVELVKREVSVLTADPRLVPSARPIPRLSYEEAEELAQFGAKVLHPLTVEPARIAHLEIVVRSLEDPRIATTIGPPRGADGMRAMTLLSPLGLVRIRVPGGRQRPGIVAEATERLNERAINIVTLFTSSSCLSLVLERGRARKAREALAPLFRAGPATLEGPIPVALVTAIGDGVLDDLGRVPASILSRGEGLSATPRSLSFAVPVAHGVAAVRALHRALVETTGR